MLDVAAVRRDFPALELEVHGHPLAYLDNASTTQKPRAVIEAITRVYETQCANIHRGVHTLSGRATEAYEAARVTVARFLGGVDEREVVFTRGTTEAINLVAQSWGRRFVRSGDAVVVSALEHHSNLVPWQMLCAEVGAELRVLPIDSDGAMVVEGLDALLDDRVRVVAVSHISNSLGTVSPVAEIAAKARAAGAITVVDGAQAAPHVPLDVKGLGCDFYAFSGHKVYGPTGVGVLWGRSERLEAMPPWQGGGDMIAEVSLQSSEYAEIPAKFEAGTPHIVGGIALGAALDYVTQVGLTDIAAHEDTLLARATELVGALDGVRLIGTAEKKAAVLSFVVEGVHPHDVGTILDVEGVAVRTGHHCTEPVMDHFDVPATVRASFGMYNTAEEVDRLAAAVKKAQETFA